MEGLRAITGSRARAGILAELLAESSGPRSTSALARAAGVRPFAVRRELASLIEAGVIRRSAHEVRVGSPLHEADPSYPGFLELQRLVRITCGVAGLVRRAIQPLDVDQLAWIHGPYAEGRTVSRRLSVAVITRRRRQVAERLREVQRDIGWAIIAEVATIAEWVLRLERREMRARAIRRRARMWLLGSEEILRQRERSEILRRETWKHALENWRDEYEWDEDFDPSDPFPGRLV